MKNLKIIFISLLVITSCRAPDDGLEVKIDKQEQESSSANSGSNAHNSYVETVFGESLQWKSHIIPVDNPRGYLGGMDITKSHNGDLLSAFTLKVLDVDAGTFLYQLIFAYNHSGRWEKKVILSSQNRFYYSQSSNAASNHLKIHSIGNGGAKILFIDNNNKLISLTILGDHVVKRSLVNEEVGVFSSEYDTVAQELHIVTMARYYNARSVTYKKYFDGNLRDSFVYTGTISPGTDNGYLIVKLYQSRPIIFLKYFENSINNGRFIMIKDQRGVVLANGVNASGVFNVFEDQGDFKTCYRNVLNERMELLIDPEVLTGALRKADYIINSNRSKHCFVSNDEHFKFAQYDINASYYSEFDLFSWGDGEYTTIDYPFQGIRFIDLREESLFIGGLDRNTGQPHFLEKQ